MPDPTHYHPDGLAAAKANAIPGCCPFCGEWLPDPDGTTRARIICGSADCARAYHRAYKRDQRAGAPRLNLPWGWVVTWHCDCGRHYVHAFFRAVHRYRCLFARDAWPLVVVQAASNQRSTQAAA